LPEGEKKLNMITLNILTDFCNYWWLWWILPFILGSLLVYTVMKKWRTMYKNLIQENRKHINKINKNDIAVANYEKEAQELKGQLAIQRGKINELERALKNK